MATRSRKGCIDCKQAKIKCDEVHPFCGTCTRRRRQCRGYAFAQSRALPLREARPSGALYGQPLPQDMAGMAGVLSMAMAMPLTMPPVTGAMMGPVTAAGTAWPMPMPAIAPPPPLPQPHFVSGLLMQPMPPTPASGLVEFAWNPVVDNWQAINRADRAEQDLDGGDLSGGGRITEMDGHDEELIDEEIGLNPASLLQLGGRAAPLPARRRQWLLASPTRGPSWIPQDAIIAADKPFVEIYFMRHPMEMVMSNDFFIDEMNCTVLSLLQRNPADVADSLSAIGENYVQDASGTALVSNRKTRLLSRMRIVNEEGGNPELVLLVLLALCGAELTDPLSDGMGTSLRALIENVALILEFHSRTGHGLNGEAKYFARGVARQDLLISLARLQRPRIDPALWLDDRARNRADRLLGLTATLTPVLAQLAALAEDVQAVVDSGMDNAPWGYPCWPLDGSMPDSTQSFGFPDCSPGAHYLLSQRVDLAEREATIRGQLLVWRPVNDTSLSLRASRKFLLHAAAWRAAALLYLFRLFNRAGGSAQADHMAQGMAYEVIMHISGQPEDTKLSLWPLFVAASEMERPEDRDTATQLFENVCRTRPILTARRTRAFCTEQIWPARDRGELWDWMTLARHSTNVFIPL